QDPGSSVGKWQGGVRRWEIEDQGLLRGAGNDGDERLIVASIDLDVRHMRWNPDKVTRLGIVARLELITAKEACLPGDDVDCALGFAVMVDGRPHAGAEFNEPDPDLAGANQVGRDGGLPQHRTACRLGRAVLRPDHAQVCMLRPSVASTSGRAHRRNYRLMGTPTTGSATRERRPAEMELLGDEEPEEKASERTPGAHIVSREAAQFSLELA